MRRARGRLVPEESELVPTAAVNAGLQDDALRWIEDALDLNKPFGA